MATKPSVAELHKFLANYMALIVHFSGLPKGTGFDISYPADLLGAIMNSDSYRLSCSLVKPGDRYDADGTVSNASGTVGLILGVKTSDSIIAVDSHDAGSGVDPKTNRKIFTDRNVSIADCIQSLVARTTYNEWGVHDYIIRGLFIFHPAQVYVLKPMNEMPGGEDLPADAGSSWFEENPTFAELASCFPGLPIYTFSSGQLVEIHPIRGSEFQVSHALIYR